MKTVVLVQRFDLACLGPGVLVNRFLRPLGLDSTRTLIPGYHSLRDFVEALCPRDRGNARRLDETGRPAGSERLGPTS